MLALALAVPDEPLAFLFEPEPAVFFPEAAVVDFEVDGAEAGCFFLGGISRVDGGRSKLEKVKLDVDHDQQRRINPSIRELNAHHPIPRATGDQLTLPSDHNVHCSHGQ